MDKGFLLGGLMAREYTKEDLCSESRIFASRLRTGVLEEFYEEYLTPNAYIFELSNGDRIHLTFDKDQFCHMLGFQYFNYNGIRGWNDLKSANILLTKLPRFIQHKREEIRMVNFPKIIEILNNPSVYLYENDDMNYRSDYFAVWSDGKRYYKLGIGKGANGVNYGETYQVSLVSSNDNKEIRPDKLLRVEGKYIVPRNVFYDEYFSEYKVESDEKIKCDKLLETYKA